jgi:hypothetical protein
MKKACLVLVLLQAVLAGLSPLVFAKTHHDNYTVPCDVLWRAVKDAIRNSGKYGIIGIDNEEMSISYNIGGTMGGKRVNSVMLNRTSESTCEMQTQTAYTGLIHNDAGDMKERVEKSLAKFSEAAPRPAAESDQPKEVASASNKPPSASTGAASLRSAELKAGQTVEDVERRMGKPQDTINLKDSIVYIYSGGKVIFEKGQVVEVQYREDGSK